jgi:CheY-like chemotaxis protein
MGDRVMIEQLIGILVANAADAAKQNRALALNAGFCELTHADLAQHPLGRAGEFICFSCQDAGEGIPASVMPHLFEPFFTTRAARSRIGMGLAVAGGIVESHQGWIEVDSRVDQGTEVRVYFPRTASPAKVATPSKTAGSGAREETILLVEDDDLLRETTVAVLKHAGYRVLQAESGESARETWQWHADRVGLLLTDIVLPNGISGLELAAEFRADSPALKVICTSGFSHEIMNRMDDLPAGFQYLPKPCLPPEMLKAVRNLLDDISV